MNAAADILGLIGKVPGMGWAKELAEDIRGAGEAMDEFAGSAFDGIKRTIEDMSGITEYELIFLG